MPPDLNRYFQHVQLAHVSEALGDHAAALEHVREAIKNCHIREALPELMRWRSMLEARIEQSTPLIERFLRRFWKPSRKTI